MQMQTKGDELDEEKEQNRLRDTFDLLEMVSNGYWCVDSDITSVCEPVFQQGMKPMC